MNKKVGIFGLGKSGIASATYFRNKGYETFVWDDSIEAIKSLDIANIIAVDYQKWPWEELESVVLAPGIPLIHPKPHRVVELAHEHGVEVICDIEVLMRDASKRAKFIGITGTNGKSTTTALIYHVLKECGVDAQIGGNFGVAALSLNAGKDSVFVLEVSSYQIDLLKKAKFDVAVLLNITPDHIDRYGSFERYTQSKKEIFKNQDEDDVAIICVDQDVTKRIAKELDAESGVNLVTYVTNGHVLKGHNFVYLPGEHNRQNIIATYFACKSIGVDEDKIIAAIKTFKGLDHRMQRVFESAEIKFINDSKATNAEATEPALKTFESVYWLAGGVPKEGGIKKLEKYFPKIKHAYFYGQAADEFTGQYKAAGHNNFTTLKTIKDAFDAAAEAALKDAQKSGQQAILLLSPACASFDEFKNYEERGKRFCEFARDFAAKNNLSEIK